MVLIDLTTCNEYGVFERGRRLPYKIGHLGDKSPFY